MHLIPLLSVAIAAAVLYAINRRVRGLPATIGVTVWALVASLALVAAGALGSPVHDFARRLVARVNFRETLLDGMLSLLLFAGALEVDLAALLGEKALVAVLATVGVAISTAIIGGLTLLVARLCGLPLELRECVLFGAIISPTDPIAVLGMLRTARAPKQLEVQMAGESLFNDAVGVVLFFTILEISAGRTVGPAAISLSFLEEVGGGAALGLGVGWIARKLLRSVERTPVAIVVTLAIAAGLNPLAQHVHAGGYLAVILAGLMLGGLRTSSGLHRFWEIVDEILNVVLFTMVGFEVLVIPFSAPRARRRAARHPHRAPGPLRRGRGNAGALRAPLELAAPVHRHSHLGRTARWPGDRAGAVGRPGDLSRADPPGDDIRGGPLLDRRAGVDLQAPAAAADVISHQACVGLLRSSSSPFRSSPA